MNMGDSTVKAGQTVLGSTEISPDIGIRKHRITSFIIYLIWESIKQWQSWFDYSIVYFTGQYV